MSERIAEARAAAGLGRRVAARRLGVSSRRLRDWEHGQELIPMSVREDMAALYGVPLETFVAPRPSGAVLSAVPRSIRIGSIILKVSGSDDDALRSFLREVRRQRRVGDRDSLPIRASDAAALTELLGGTPERVVARIAALLDLTEGDAEELSSWLWRHRALAGAAAATVGLGTLTAVAWGSGGPTSPARSPAKALSAGAVREESRRVDAVAKETKDKAEHVGRDDHRSDEGEGGHLEE